MLFILLQRILTFSPNGGEGDIYFYSFQTPNYYKGEVVALLPGKSILRKTLYWSVFTMCTSFKPDRSSYQCPRSSTAIYSHPPLEFRWGRFMTVGPVSVSGHMSLWKYCPSLYLHVSICVCMCRYCICICMYESRDCGPFYYLNGPRQRWAGTNHTNLLW